MWKEKQMKKIFCTYLQNEDEIWEVWWKFQEFERFGRGERVERMEVLEEWVLSETCYIGGLF